jgi:type IV secretory pathway component VirB8
MDRDSISGEMTGTTVILPLKTIEKYIAEINNNDKHSLQRGIHHNGKKNTILINETID